MSVPMDNNASQKAGDKMPIWLQMARSYNNPDSVNYKIAYLREKIGDADFGKLAYADQVQLAMLGDTIVVGGYLKTELIKAKSIVADHLNVDDLAAISGNFSGNVLVGGDLLVGGQGVLSVFQYISTGDALNADGWSNFGCYDTGGTEKIGYCRLTVPVPERFIITKATLTVEAMARYVYDVISETGYWYQSKKLKLYRASGDRAVHYYPVPSSDSDVVVQIPLWTIVTKISFSLTSISTHVQIPLWTIVTFRQFLCLPGYNRFRFLYGRL